MVKKAIQGIIDMIYPLFKKFMPFPIYSYLAVGGINTALNILIFSGLYHFLLPKSGLDLGFYKMESYSIALIIAFLLTIPTGFWLTQNFAFAESKGDKKQDAKQGFRYFLVVSQGLISDYLLLNFLVVYVKFSPDLAKIVSTIIVLTLNYLLQKHFTFKPKSIA